MAFSAAISASASAASSGDSSSLGVVAFTSAESTSKALKIMLTSHKLTFKKDNTKETRWLGRTEGMKTQSPLARGLQKADLRDQFHCHPCKK